MRIVKRGFSFPLALLVFGLSACTTSAVPQNSPVITPITYRPLKNSAETSIGRLRRLAIAPVRSLRPVGVLCLFCLAPSTFKEGDEKTKNALLSEAISFLADWKGYEVVTIDPHDDLLQQKLRLSPEEIRRHLDALVDWPIESDTRVRRNKIPVAATVALSLVIKHTRKSAPSPTDISSTASAIGRALNVDGLVIIQGYGPVWDLFGDKEKMHLRADIYEVSSGKVVWTNEVVDAPIGNAGEMLFDSLEDATPKVLVEEKR